MLTLINLVILIGAGLLVLSTFTSLLSRRPLPFLPSGKEIAALLRKPRPASGDAASESLPDGVSSTQGEAAHASQDRTS